MTVKPLSAMGPTFTRMAGAAQAANVETVSEATGDLWKVTVANGARFTLRGRGGKQVPLTAAKNVRAFGADPVGMVKGVPEGFWHIVEYGRGGGYLVAGQKRSGGRVGQRGLTKRFDSDSTFGDLAPISTPYGPRQFARPGPHGSIGKPWASSMAAGRPLVARRLQMEETRALVRVFTS